MRNSKLHRFLQPDNNIQDPFNSQNYNRYGYVLNNPLKYTDESGEFWQFAAVALAAYIYGGAATGEANPLKWNMQNLLGAFSGIGSGLATSYAKGATNSYIDNYNNKPALGASAVEPQYADVHALVNNDKFSFWEFYASVNFDSSEKRNTVSSLVNSSIFTVIGYGLTKFEKSVEKVADLKNFKIPDRSDMLTTIARKFFPCP